MYKLLVQRYVLLTKILHIAIYKILRIVRVSDVRIMILYTEVTEYRVEIYTVSGILVDIDSDRCRYM